jgi:penicillin-insensitive murein endopeptidase
MLRLLVILAGLVVSASAPLFAAERPAKELFGAAALPADLPPSPIGFYSRGCMAGAVQLAPDGPNWQAMRLSRNRQWGLPILVDFLQNLAQDAAAQDGWPGLLVGDMAQPRGGPMSSGHASHQIGLDADIWLTPMPNRRLSGREREDISATPMVEPGPHIVYADRWTAAHGRLIRRAALDPRVERIFVAPGIKKKLCETAGSDRGWLRKVRPYYGHNYHFHVRLSCPPGTPCRGQAAPPPGDGCGADLDYWFSAAPYKQAAPPTKPQRPPKPVTLADLPPACATVIGAAPTPGSMTMQQAFSGYRGPVAAAPAFAEPAAPAADPLAALIQAPRLPRPRPQGF